MAVDSSARVLVGFTVRTGRLRDAPGSNVATSIWLPQGRGDDLASWATPRPGRRHLAGPIPSHFERAALRLAVLGLLTLMRRGRVRCLAICSDMAADQIVKERSH